jgi:hypothetical protein
MVISHCVISLFIFDIVCALAVEDGVERYLAILGVGMGACQQLGARSHVDVDLTLRDLTLSC